MNNELRITGTHDNATYTKRYLLRVTYYALLTVIVLFTIFFLIPNSLFIIPVYAQEIQYSEFTSLLTSNSITVVNVKTPSQHFKPFDDFISGVDLWLDNPGGAGSATFELRRVVDAELLASKTVSIPSIPAVWRGQQFHVSFNSPTPVAATTIYKINVISSMSNLRLYYSDLVVVRQHNSTYSAGDTVLPAHLGLDSQNFAFQFALYEESETAQPIISNTTVTVSSPTNTNISFNANEPVDYRILFAPSGNALTSGTSFKNTYTQCGAGLRTCNASLTTAPNTTYDYELTAKDRWGNESAKNGTFTSLVSSSPTSTSPVPTLIITNEQVSSLTPNSATVSWTTNVAANSSMLLSISGTQGIVQTVLSVGDATFELEHTVSTGPILAPNTFYSAKLISFDSNGITKDATLTFTTPSVTQTSGPEPEPQTDATTTGATTTAAATATSSTSTTGTATGGESSSEITVDLSSSGGGGSSVTIMWSTPGSGSPSDGYRIDIFDTDNNLKLSISTDTNSVTVDDLAPGDYHAVVYKNEGGVFEKIADSITFSVPGVISPLSKRVRLYSIVIILFSLAGLSMAFVKLRKKKSGKKEDSSGSESGFSLIELLIATGIMVAIVTLVGVLGRDVTDVGVEFAQRFAVQQEIELTVKEMLSEIRATQPSNEGSYAIMQASTSTFAFYTDIGADGLVERVRYFLDDGTLKKGIITPSGSPLQYATSSEIISEVVQNIAVSTSSIFSYYDSNFSGTEAPLADPVIIADIRLIEINLAAQDITQAVPISSSIRVTPRNLRTNL